MKPRDYEDEKTDEDEMEWDYKITMVNWDKVWCVNSS